MIKVLKLLSGDDIIVDVVSELNGDIVCLNPAAIVIQQQKDGQIGAGLQPYAPFAKDSKITLYRHSLAGEMDIDVQLQNEYSRIFGTGIQIATAEQASKIKLA